MHGALAHVAAGSVSALQRQEATLPAAKSEEEKYKEAAKKTGETLLETETGKKIKDKAGEVATSLPGLVIIGSAATAIVTKAAVKNEALPFQPPAVPLDKVGLPGVKMKLTWEGPVRNPTKAMIGFSGTFGGPRKKSKGDKPTAAERQRAENLRKAEELRQFREGLKSPEQRAAEDEAVMRYVVQQVQDPSSPLYIPNLKPADKAPKLAPKEEKTEEEAVQREAIGPAPASAPPAVHETIREPGRPLDLATRSLMEHRMGHDFSRVRIHTDQQAATSAEAVQARAYTVGRDIVFGSGAYRPSTSTGQRLLAHELVHVVQQEGANRSGKQAQFVQRQTDPGQEERPAPSGIPTANPTPSPTTSSSGGSPVADHSPSCSLSTTGIPPSLSSCSAYAQNAWWLPMAYVNNTTCACMTTPNSTTANCVRGFLQHRLAATPTWLKNMAFAHKPLDIPGSPLYAGYQSFVQTYLTPRFYQDHVDAYQNCCCPSGPAAYPSWVAVASVPLQPCSLIGLSIRYFGSCHGTPGAW
jgi:hypothetical protein